MVTAAEAAAWAEVVAVMVSDEAHRDLWADELAPHVRPGAALVFAHGLSVRFGLVQPPPDLDVILASPKGIGPRIREIYEQGDGVFCLFGVHQDATGQARSAGPVLRRGAGLRPQGHPRDHLRTTSAKATCSASRWCCAAAWAS